VTALDREGVHLLSVIPRQETGSFWERVIQPHVFFVLASRVGNLRRRNRTRVTWDAIANGQFILTPRAQYEAVGTHEIVKNQVAEDVAIAQAYARAGKDVFLLHAQTFMATRMYRSLGEIVEGWSKNMALGAPLTLPPIRLVRGLAPYVMWTPVLVWVLPPIVWALTGWTPAAIATVLSLAIWLVTYAYERVNPAYALLYPLGAVAVALIMIKSAWRGARRVEWKGRVYGR
jgi:chlorobactene glucosyltransferase